MTRPALPFWITLANLRAVWRAFERQRRLAAACAETDRITR